MAEQEEQQITVPDAPVPGPSQTGRAVALARLLHHECTRLLQLYVSYQSTHSLALCGEGRSLPVPLLEACFNTSMLL